MATVTYQDLQQIIDTEVAKFRGWNARAKDLDLAARLFEDGMATMAARLSDRGAVDWHGRN